MNGVGGAGFTVLGILIAANAAAASRRSAGLLVVRRFGRWMISGGWRMGGDGWGRMVGAF